MDPLLLNTDENETDEDEEEDEENSPSHSPPRTFQQQCDGFNKRLLAAVQEAENLKHNEAKYLRHDTLLAYKNVDLNNKADSLHLEFQELRRKIEESSVFVNFSVLRCLELLVRLDSICRSISEKAEGAADKDLVESLPTLLISENPLKYGFFCALCKNVFEVTEEVRTLPCSNRDLFHSSCITTWLKTCNCCPSCAEIFPEQRREEVEEKIEEESDEDLPSPSPPLSIQQQCDGFYNRLVAAVQEARDLKRHEAKFMRKKILAFKNVDLNNSADSLHLEFQELRRKVANYSSALIDFWIPRCLEHLQSLDSIRESISESAEEAADKELVESLPSLVVSENPLKHSFACIICKKVFAEAEKVRMVPCSYHDIFHSRCITTWLKTWNHCPNCAQIFPKQRRSLK